MRLPTAPRCPEGFFDARARPAEEGDDVIGAVGLGPVTAFSFPDRSGIEKVPDRSGSIQKVPHGTHRMAAG